MLLRVAEHWGLGSGPDPVIARVLLRTQSSWFEVSAQPLKPSRSKGALRAQSFRMGGVTEKKLAAQKEEQRQLERRARYGT